MTIREALREGTALLQKAGVPDADVDACLLQQRRPLAQLGNKDVVIVLMHEAKTRTRRILPELVAFFRDRGYEFRKLSAEPEDAEILSRCSANMMLPAAQE